MEEEEEEDNRSGWASWGGSSATGSSPEEAGAVSLLRLDSEWRSFLGHWNHPMLRSEIADCIPSLVAIIWRDDFCRLAHGDQDHPASGLPPASLGPEDENAARQAGRLLHSILNRTRVTGAAMLLALFFVHRYRETPDAPIGRPGSQYRLFLVGMLLAHKYTEDHPFSNRVWAHLAGMHVIHINSMEREFLHQISHRLGVKLQDFQRWVTGLDRRFQWTAAVREHCIMPALAPNYRLMPLPPPPSRYLAVPHPATTPRSVQGPQLRVPPIARTRNRDPWPHQPTTRTASRRDSVHGPMFSL